MVPPLFGEKLVPLLRAIIDVSTFPKRTCLQHGVDPCGAIRSARQE